MVWLTVHAAVQGWLCLSVGWYYGRWKGYLHSLVCGFVGYLYSYQERTLRDLHIMHIEGHMDILGRTFQTGLLNEWMLLSSPHVGAGGCVI